MAEGVKAFSTDFNFPLVFCMALSDSLPPYGPQFLQFIRQGSSRCSLILLLSPVLWDRSELGPRSGAGNLTTRPLERGTPKSSSEKHSKKKELPEERGLSGEAGFHHLRELLRTFCCHGWIFRSSSITEKNFFNFLEKTTHWPQTHKLLSSQNLLAKHN